MYLGLKLLPLQLGVMALQEKENLVSRFEDGFKQMWVNNGNSLSKIYAGTGALCSGGSKLLDGARSAARSLYSIFYEGFKWRFKKTSTQSMRILTAR